MADKQDKTPPKAKTEFGKLSLAVPLAIVLGVINLVSQKKSMCCRPVRVRAACTGEGRLMADNQYPEVQPFLDAVRGRDVKQFWQAIIGLSGDNAHALARRYAMPCLRGTLKQSCTCSTRLPLSCAVSR